MSFDQAIAVAKAVAEVAAAVAWPLVIMILVCVFYKPITSLLSRVREIKASGVEVLVDRLEEQGKLPVGGRAELQGLTSHDIWALDTFAKVPMKIAAMTNPQRVAARTLLDAGLLVLQGTGVEREVEVAPLGKELLEAAKTIL